MDEALIKAMQRSALEVAEDVKFGRSLAQDDIDKLKAKVETLEQQQQAVLAKLNDMADKYSIAADKCELYSTVYYQMLDRAVALREGYGEVKKIIEGKGE